MPSFTVTSEPVEGETYRNEKAKSDLVVWRFDLEDQGTVQLHKKPGNKPPGMGTVVNGDLKDAGRGEKRLYLDKPNPNGGGGGGGGKTYERSPDHQLNMARALHTSTLSSAPAVIDQMIALGVQDSPADKDEYRALVVSVAKWLRSTYPLDVLKWADG